MSAHRGRLVARRLAEAVQAVAPPGLGTWPPAWELVAAPSHEFLAVLDVWEAEDTPATRARLQTAADDVVRAWRRAADAWTAAGRPDARPRTLLSA